MTVNHKGKKNFKTGVDSALEYISEHYKEVLCHLDPLKLFLDAYIATIKLLLPLRLISQNEAQRILSFVIKNQPEDGNWPRNLVWATRFYR